MTVRATYCKCTRKIPCSYSQENLDPSRAPLFKFRSFLLRTERAAFSFHEAIEASRLHATLPKYFSHKAPFCGLVPTSRRGATRRNITVRSFFTDSICSSGRILWSVMIVMNPSRNEVFSSEPETPASKTNQTIPSYGFFLVTFVNAF